MQEENIKECLGGLDSNSVTVVIDGSAFGNPGPTDTGVEITSRKTLFVFPNQCALMAKTT